jgi:ParB/RepB/Spo0J family partition protein
MLNQVVMVDVAALEVDNYRKHTSAHIDRLANSIRAQGLRNPITVYEDGAPGKYVVWSGEGRLRACKRLGWEEMPAIVMPKPADEAERIVGQMTDNDREPADPITEAQAIKAMLEFGKTEQWVADQLGQGKAWVVNRLKLLSLSPGLQLKVQRGELSASAALKLKGKPKAAAQVAATEGRVTVKAVKEVIAEEEGEAGPGRMVDDYDALLARLEEAKQAVVEARSVQADPINKARITTALDGIRQELCEEEPLQIMDDREYAELIGADYE